jgi:hypothetical protein
MKTITNLLFSITAIWLLYACGPSVKTQASSTENLSPLDYRQEVYVYTADEVLPGTITKDIGSIKIGDSGFSTNCNYETVIATAKEEARKNGGNVVLIEEHKTPDFWSLCHRIKAKILLVDIDSLSLTNTGYQSSIEGEDYALLYVYRYGGAGALINYDLHLGDSTICKVKNNSAEIVKITKRGMNSLWAKTETKVEIPITVEFGHEYYISCGVKMGVVVGRPTIQIVSPAVGQKEFNAVINKKSKKK